MAAPRAQHDRRPDRDRPPVGGGRQLAALRPGAGASGRRRRARDRAHGPPRDRLVRAADRQRLRAVSVPRSGSCRPRATGLRRSGTRRSSSSISPSTRSSLAPRATLPGLRPRSEGTGLGRALRPIISSMHSQVAGTSPGRSTSRTTAMSTPHTRPSTGSSLSMQVCRLESRRAVSSRRRCGHRPASGLRQRRPGR